MSQRQMAEAAAVPKSTLAGAEAGSRDLGFRVLARVVAVAGLRLALVDADGHELPPMSGSGVRDEGGRRFPAHLDTRFGDEDWWHGEDRYSRTRPWFTFDLSRTTRDLWRERTGIPEDHREPQPGDSPQERRAARRQQERERDRLRQVRAAGPRVEEWACTCPPGCDEVEDWSGRPAHVENCPCRCDVG